MFAPLYDLIYPFRMRASVIDAIDKYRQKSRNQAETPLTSRSYVLCGIMVLARCVITCYEPCSAGLHFGVVGLINGAGAPGWNR